MLAILFLIVIIIMAICFAIALIRTAVWALFFRVLNLGFLPAGIGIAEGIAETGVYVLPSFLGQLVEVPLHFFLTLWIQYYRFCLCNTIINSIWKRIASYGKSVS